MKIFIKYWYLGNLQVKHWQQPSYLLGTSFIILLKIPYLFTAYAQDMQAVCKAVDPPQPTQHLFLCSYEAQISSSADSSPFLVWEDLDSGKNIDNNGLSGGHCNRTKCFLLGRASIWPGLL